VGLFKGMKKRSSMTVLTLCHRRVDVPRYYGIDADFFRHVCMFTSQGSREPKNTCFACRIDCCCVSAFDS
jgi:hypothetical protein